MIIIMIIIVTFSSVNCIYLFIKLYIIIITTNYYNSNNNNYSDT